MKEDYILTLTQRPWFGVGRVSYNASILILLGFCVFFLGCEEELLF